MKYSTSTQYSFWQFDSEEQIKEYRKHFNQTSIERLNKVMGSSEVIDSADFKGFLTVEEEEDLIIYYVEKILALAKAYKPCLSLKVTATAIAYFRRFFILNSVMDFNAKEIMFTCLFLACKSEEEYKSINQFFEPSTVRKMQNKLAPAIRKLETVIAQHLHFHLQVHNAIRPIHGFLADFQMRSGASEQDIEKIKTQIYPKALDKLENSLKTNAGLLYSPSHLGAACITSAMHDYNTNHLFEAYLNKVLNLSSEDLASIQNAVKCISNVKKAKTAKIANDKLKKCGVYLGEDEASEKSIENFKFHRQCLKLS